MIEKYSSKAHDRLLGHKTSGCIMRTDFIGQFFEFHHIRNPNCYSRWLPLTTFHAATYTIPQLSLYHNLFSIWIAFSCRVRVCYNVFQFPRIMQMSRKGFASSWPLPVLPLELPPPLTYGIRMPLPSHHLLLAHMAVVLRFKDMPFAFPPSSWFRSWYRRADVMHHMRRDSSQNCRHGKHVPHPLIAWCVSWHRTFCSSIHFWKTSWRLFNGRLLGVQLRKYGSEIAVQWPLTWLLVDIYTFLLTLLLRLLEAFYHQGVKLLAQQQYPWLWATHKKSDVYCGWGELLVLLR